MNTVMQELIRGCVRDAIENEGGKFKVNQDSLDQFLKFGAGVDALAAQTMVYDVAAGVRTGTKEGFATFEVDDLVFERGASDPFFTAMQGVSSIKFTKSKSERLAVTAIVTEVLVRA